MYTVNVQGLTKDYRIYERPFHRLLEAITKRPYHRVNRVLDDLSFSILPKQSLGIIGDNGAGKTTLLKLLARTLTPSNGRIDISGRISALLELGAGFHPEFTGRQNLFLNGALVGMGKAEIREKENEIIEFSGLEQYIDRPVKTYSSGMYIRLAFSIATSINPDILIIDEALSVGDLTFQRKCIDRMNFFRNQGKTMIFCSHSMFHVLELCDKVLWLDQGKIRAAGPAAEIVSEYEEYSRSGKRDNDIDDPIQVQMADSRDCRIRNLRIENGEGNTTEIITPLSDLTVKMDVDILEDNLKPQFGFAFIRQDDTPYFVSMTHHDHYECETYRAGDTVQVSLIIKNFPIREGTYRFMGGVAEESGLLWYEYDYIWPIKIEVTSGIGLVTSQREWRISHRN